MNENKMKTKRSSKRSGPSCQGNVVSTHEKKTVSQAKQTSLVSSRAQVRPFAGKVFYLDLPSNRAAETLETDIKDLGGTVEKFFSKDIRYLVSNKREAKYAHCLRKESPVPSPDSGPSSPHLSSNPHHPGNCGESIKSRSLGQAEVFVTSRGKSLVEKVVKEQGRIQMDRMLSNALEWGVKILYIDDLIAYVQKKKKVFSNQVLATAAAKPSVKIEAARKQASQKCKGGRLTKPFIKVEDSTRHYRPICLTMPNMPEFNLKSAAPCSPFCLQGEDLPGTKQQRGVKAPASENQGRKKNRDKKRGGYCECCMIKYNNLTMHLQSERHKAFSKSDEYLVVDQLVSTLQCNFIHYKTKVKRSKCSVSSVLVAPGPCGKTEPRHKGSLDFSESVKGEEHGTVDGSDGSYSEQNMKIGSASCSAPLIHAKGNRANFYTYSDRPKHKSLAHKRIYRNNSSTSCTRKSEQARIPQLKSETAPSASEIPPSLPSRVTQDEPVDQTPQKDTNTSMPHLHCTNVSSEVLARRVNVKTHEQEAIKKGKSHSDAVHERNVFSEKGTGNNLSENEEGSRPTQSFSPVRKIRRRIRVYKRKRRKMDTNTECVKPNDVPDSSILRLLEIFQSSDDMDVEFHGFMD